MENQRMENTDLETRIGQRIMVLKRQGEFEPMVAWLGDLLEQDSIEDGHFRARLWTELGLAHLALDRPSRARSCYELALVSNPRHINALYNLGSLAMEGQDHAEARDHFTQVLKLKPDHAGALYNLALCHVLAQELDRAAPLFIRVTQLNSQYMGAFYWAGESLLSQEDYGVALDYFARAVALDPHHPGSARGLAICQLKNGNPRAALETCQGLLMATGPEPTALKIMGDAQLAMDCPREAALCHLDMVSLDPEASSFVISRARELLKEAPESAAPYAQRIIQDLPELEAGLKGVWGRE